MPTTPYKIQFEVRKQQFHTESHRDQNAYYAENGRSVAQLQSHLTYLFGEEQSYPLTQMLLGDANGAKTPKIINEIQYDYPVMGKNKKVSRITKTNGTANLGKGHSTFFLYFEDNWIKRFNVIRSNGGAMVRITKDLVQDVDGTWRAECQLMTASATDVLPASEATVGARWIPLYSPVSLERSRGSEVNTTTYGKVKNQIGFLKKTMGWGDSTNLDKVMEVEMKVDGKSTKNWMSYFLYQFEKVWQEEMENALWYSKYNMDNSTGQITLKDVLTGESIPQGAGLLDQIVNYDTFSTLTYKKLMSSVTDAFFGHNDTKGKTVILSTGTGGMRDFDAAIRKEGFTMLSGSLGDIADKFITGSNYNLALGGYFDRFYHIDGYTVMIKYNPLFDHGCVAQVSDKHPISGLPIESHRMVFLDNSIVDGENNLQMLQYMNAGFIHSVALGQTNAPADLKTDAGSVYSAVAPLRMSEINEGQYARATSLGIQLLRPNLSLHLECVAS